MSQYFKNNKGAKKSKAQPEEMDENKMDEEELPEPEEQAENHGEDSPEKAEESKLLPRIEQFYEDFLVTVDCVEAGQSMIKELKAWLDDYANNVKGGKSDIKRHLTPPCLKETFSSVNQKHQGKWKEFPKLWQLMVNLLFKIGVNTVVIISIFQLIEMFRTEFCASEAERLELEGLLADQSKEGWKQVNIEQMEKYAKAFCATHPSDPEQVASIKTCINEYYKGQNLKHSALMIMAFNQQASYDIEELIVKLLHKDLIDEAIKLVGTSEHWARTCIFALNANKYAKRARDLIKKFKLNPYDFKHIVHAEAFLALRSSVKRLGWKVTEERMLSYAKDDKHYWTIFIEVLMKDDLLSEALSVVQRNGLDLPQRLMGRLSQAKGLKSAPNHLLTLDYFGPTEVKLSNLKLEDYITLKDFGISESDVIFVDQVDEKFFKATGHLLQQKVLGVDAEWDGDLLGYKESQVATLQVASDKFCAVFDMMKLKKTEQMYEFCAKIFEDPEVEIIGHTFTSDIKCLRETFSNRPMSFNSIICVEDAFVEGKSKPGLAAIIKILYGKILCKHDQQSNWKRRPLRRSQLHYAALDAVGTLNIYLKLKKDGKEELLDSLHMQNYSSAVNPDQERMNAKAQIVQNEQLIKVHQSTGEFKFVVDGMLKKLAFNLRNVGLDATFAEETMKPREIVNLAETENRIILTRDTKLMNCRKSTLLIKITSSNPFSQLEQVLDLLEIHITKEDLLSRCVKCNAKDLLWLSFDQAQETLKWEKVEDQSTQPKDFWQCQQCKQIYWEGGTFDRAQKMFQELIKKQASKQGTKANPKEVLKADFEEPDQAPNNSSEMMEEK